MNTSTSTIPVPITVNPAPEPYPRASEATSRQDLSVPIPRMTISIVTAALLFGLTMGSAGTVSAAGVDIDLSSYPEMKSRKLTLPEGGEKPYPVILAAAGAYVDGREFLDNGYAVLSGLPVKGGPTAGSRPSGGELCIQEAKSAVRWVRAHGAKHDLDPKHIGAACTSFDTFTMVGIASSGGIKKLTFGDKTWDLVGPHPANPDFDDHIQCVVGRPWGAVLEDHAVYDCDRNPHLNTEEWFMWLGIPLLASSNSPPMISDGGGHRGNITGVYLTKCFLNQAGVPFVNMQSVTANGLRGVKFQSMVRIAFADVYLKEASTTKVFAEAMYSATAGGTYSWFTFARIQKDLSKPLTIKFNVGGSAKAGIDYEMLPTSVTIPAGKAELDLKVKALIGAATKADKQIALTIQPDAAYEIPYTPDAIMKIVESADPEIVTFGTVPFAKGPAGKGVITVARVGSLEKPLSVQVDILTNGKEGVDFEPIKTPIVIPAGAYETQVPVIPKRYPADGGKLISVVILVKDGDGYFIGPFLGGSYSHAAGVVIVNANPDARFNFDHHIPNPFGPD